MAVLTWLSLIREFHGNSPMSLITTLWGCLSTSPMGDSPETGYRNLVLSPAPFGAYSIFSLGGLQLWPIGQKAPYSMAPPQANAQGRKPIGQNTEGETYRLETEKPQ